MDKMDECKMEIMFVGWDFFVMGGWGLALGVFSKCLSNTKIVNHTNFVSERHRSK